MAEQSEQIDRNLKHATALYEHKRVVELEKEKMVQKQEGINRAHVEEFGIWKKKLELKQAQMEPPETVQMASKVMRMPKLVIKKFDGTPQDWLRFWGQFESRIDESGAPEDTKFSYLKEFVNSKVRNLIDGLPFTPEGYQKAEDLLTKRHGKASEVLGPYARNILELPTVRRRTIKKIHECYEVLHKGRLYYCIMLDKEFETSEAIHFENTHLRSRGISVQAARNQPRRDGGKEFEFLRRD